MSQNVRYDYNKELFRSVQLIFLDTHVPINSLNSVHSEQSMLYLGHFFRDSLGTWCFLGDFGLLTILSMKFSWVLRGR